MNDTALHAWGRTVATVLGAEYKKSGDDFILKPSSESWQQITGTSDPIQINAEPQDKTSWRNRLRYTEQSVAQAILAGPVGFSCKLEDGRGKPATIFRLAIGLSLSTGHACRRRYSVYCYEGSAFYANGPDHLFDRADIITSLDLGHRQTQSALAEISKMLPQIAASYASDLDVVEQVNYLNKNLASELRDLNRLYLSGHGKHARLIGNPPNGLRGEDAIEAEYMNRMRDLVARYQIAIRFEPLTFSLIHCRLQKRQDKNGFQVKLPFVEQFLKVALY